MEIGLSLGSNLGNRLAHLKATRDRVAELDGVSLIAQSSVYDTEPVDVAPEHMDKPFLNAVIILETQRTPHELADAMHGIEDALGRARTKDCNAPRTVDIDFLYADDLVSDTYPLTLPHPRWHERRFVVQPLTEIQPNRILPGQTQTVLQLLLALPETPKVVLFSETW